MYNTYAPAPDDYQGNPNQNQGQFPQPDQQQAPSRQQMLSKMMMGMGKSGGGKTEYAGGWAIPQSPYAGIGDMIGNLAGSFNTMPAGGAQPFNLSQLFNKQPSAPQTSPIPTPEVQIKPLGY